MRELSKLDFQVKYEMMKMIKRQVTEENAI